MTCVWSPQQLILLGTFFLADSEQTTQHVKVLLKVWQSSLFVIVAHAHVHIIIMVNEHNVKTLLRGIVEV